MDITTRPIHISDADFETTVLQADKPVLVDFWATWCPPCRMVAPFVEELANEYVDRAIIAKMDTDENPMTPSQFGIMGIPTLIFFKGGKEVDRMVGVPRQPKEVLRAKLEAILNTPVPAA